MSNSTLESKPIICEEVFDEHSVPSEEEVIEYAKKIGINPKCEPHLLPIAFQGLMQPLPKGWKPCLDASINRWYYYNKVTKVSQWEHPLDSVYRDLVKRGRSEGYSSAADDDSKGTAKEDLKSLEEVSDLPSSKSHELKQPPPVDSPPPPNISTPSTPTSVDDMKPHQPLLLRRKQMQSGIDQQGPLSSLQIAKMMNNTMREKTTLDFESAEESTRPFSIPPARTSNSAPVTPKQLQPIRRAKTLDPIPNYGSSKGGPIKGILREPSFSGLPTKLVPRTNPDKAAQDDEEKKRSVRFADSERKLLDIRFSDSEDSLSDEDENVSDSESPDSDDQGSYKESQNKATIFNRLNLNAEGIKLINKKLEAINVSNIKEKLLNSPSNVKPLESSDSDDDDESDDGNLPAASVPPRVNNLNKPSRTPSVSSSIGGQKTGRFVVSKTVLVQPETVDAVQSQPSFTDVTQTSDRDSDKAVTVICEERPFDTSLAREPSEEDLKTSELEDIARTKTAERLAALEERLSKEIVEKVAKMKAEQTEKLDRIKEELAQQEVIEKENIIKEHNEKLAQMKFSLQQELTAKENDLKQRHKQELDALIKNLEDERDSRKEAALALHDSLLTSSKEDDDKRFNAEKARLEAESNAELLKRQEMLRAEVEILKDVEESKLQEIRADSLSKIDDLKKHYDSLIKNEEDKYLNELNKIQTDHSVKLNNVQIEKGVDLRRVQTEWEDKIKASELQHKSILETAMVDHEKSMASLRQQFTKEEEALKREHAEQIEAWNARLKKLNDKEPGAQSANRDYEKMRCEKRLIEDKYRSLKDKYIQLKTDMKVAVEKKIQSRARRRKEEILGLEKDLELKEKTKNANNNVVESSDNAKPNAPRINVEQLRLKDTHDDILSDDQYTSLTLTLPTDDQKSLSLSPVQGDNGQQRRKRHSRGRFRIESIKEGQGNVLDDVKSQLQELEQIEEQIPAQSQGDTYLRYPFQGSGLSTSAEVDFYRHRVIVEQEAVRAARECLLQQKRELEARQSILRTNNNTSTMQQLQQQERDLTEMEVSLHRTRALLGEKMIRLRLLGQTLNRLVDDSPSPTSNSTRMDPVLSPSVAGFPAETVPFNVLQNLENINSEIREIWSQLSKQQTEGATPLEDPATTYSKTTPRRTSSKPLRRLPSNRAEIEARIQGLREWLQKPLSSNVDWNQLTL